eukprot:2405765-Prymnesium_polylepis.1
MAPHTAGAAGHVAGAFRLCLQNDEFWGRHSTVNACTCKFDRCIHAVDLDPTVGSIQLRAEQSSGWIDPEAPGLTTGLD